MQPYIVALGAGLLVGVIYGVLNVRSPAPPIIALVGLLGILMGEQIPPLVKRVTAGQEISLKGLRHICWNHMFGALPTRHAEAEPKKPSEPIV